MVAGKAILEELVEFAIGLSFEEIPKAVIRQANRCLFDLIGCFYGGLSVKRCRELIDFASELNPTPEVTLWGTCKKGGMAEAAFVHGCVAHHLEYDDGISLGAHWASETIPAILSMAETNNSNGSDVLTSLIMAYEIGNRVSQVFSKELLEKGIHFPCTMGVFGAIIGVARIARLSFADTIGALGNACLAPIAPYIPAIRGAPIKDAYAGWPNFLGIRLAQFSPAGLGGPQDLLEGPSGIARIFDWSHSLNELRKRITHGMGKEFQIMKTYFKPYPCCRWFHAPVWAILKMKNEGGWEGEDVSSILIEGPAFLKAYNKKDGFHEEIAARFSLPFVAASAALSGHMGLEEFQASQRMSALLNKLVNQVTVVKNSIYEKIFPSRFQARVTIRLKSGKQLEKECGLPWGPDNPPTDRELEDKFIYLAGLVLKPSLIEQWQSFFTNGIENDFECENLFGLLKENVES